MKEADFSLFEDAADIVDVVVGFIASEADAIPHWRRILVVLQSIDDLSSAMELALQHYLPLDLTESFLQGSSLGPPAVKWAKFTTADLESATKVTRHVLRIFAPIYYKISWQLPLTRKRVVIGLKDADRWHEVWRSTASLGAISKDGQTFQAMRLSPKALLLPDGFAFRSMTFPPVAEPFSMQIDPQRKAIRLLIEGGTANRARVIETRDRLAALIASRATIDSLVSA